MKAAISDNQGIARVDFLADGNVFATELHSGTDGSWRAVWDASTASGPHQLSVRAFDTSGKQTTAGPVAIMVSNTPNAAYDPSQLVPACANPASFCDPGACSTGGPRSPSRVGSQVLVMNFAVPCPAKGLPGRVAIRGRYSAGNSPITACRPSATLDDVDDLVLALSP